MAKVPAKKVAKTPAKKVVKKSAVKKPAAKAKKSPVKKVAKKVAKKATPKKAPKKVVAKKVAKKTPAKKKPAAKKATKPVAKKAKKPVPKKVKKPKKAKKVVPKKPKKPKRKKGQKKDKDAPKRAMSAFFLFAQDERPKVKAANPSASIGDIGKELGARWANCPAAAKAGYDKKAAALKVKQQAEMAKYKAAKAKAAGPKRALSAFFIFAADERPKVVAGNATASIGEIGKELGARWAKASAGVKAAYQAKSDKDKARYAAEKAKFVAKK
jgi:hypothetical protein